MLFDTNNIVWTAPFCGKCHNSLSSKLESPGDHNSVCNHKISCFYCL